MSYLGLSESLAGRPRYFPHGWCACGVSYWRCRRQRESTCLFLQSRAVEFEAKEHGGSRTAVKKTISASHVGTKYHEYEASKLTVYFLAQAEIFSFAGTETHLAFFSRD